MRKSSTGRRSSTNPVRVSTLEEKSAGRSDSRRTQPFKLKGQIQTDNSQIPRPRIRSSSSERASVRPSSLKPPGKTPLRQQYGSVGRSSFVTPVRSSATPRLNSHHLHPDLPLGSRAKSPSADRASGFSNKGIRKDDRPLNDKLHQTWMLNKIDTFFYHIQQVSLLNNNSGSLKPISLKMFVDVTGCLLKVLEIKLDLTVGNYTEEIPKIAKKLHYPGAMTKSWLKTANTIHSWPQVLGWLSWLVEFCEAKDLAMLSFNIENLPFLGIDREDKKNRSIFLAIVKFYAAWNEEKLEEEAALIEQHMQEIGNQGEDIDKESAALNIDVTKAEIEAENERRNEIDEEDRKTNQILEDLMREDCKENADTNLMEERIQNVELEIKQLNVDSVALENDIRKDDAQQTELHLLIKNQPMPVQERNTIETQSSQMQNYIHQFDSHIEEIENQLYAMDIKFAAVNQNLCKAIFAYNKDVICHLDLYTDTNCEEFKIPEKNMLGDDFMEMLRSKETAMTNLTERTNEQINQIKSVVDRNANELDSLQDKIKALQEDNEKYIVKMSEQKMSIQETQRLAKENEAKLKKQISNLQTQITELQQSMPNFESVENEVTEVKDKVQAVVRRKEFHEKQAERFFPRMYQILDNNRNELANIFKKLHKPSKSK